ncbi:hypothetical protein [Nostoc sp. LPT]|uniref:hypothetical protein n=1 Tax=Nostoc sp. LPT TaxID=2815387 RepID=UPI001DA05D54|nr:hypothetical protein [Nostoc sp. LPT]MBN4007035.1 hypothetical protein [Nostoc sp. LPT]
MSTAKYPVGGSVEIGHWALGIGHWALGIEKRRGARCGGRGENSSPLLPAPFLFPQSPIPNPYSPRKEKISKFNPRRALVAKKLGYATRSHQFTRLQTIPSIVTLFKTFSFLLGDGYPT